MLLASCLLAAVGQLLFRTGAAGRTEIAEFLNPQMLAGLAAYAASTALWVLALARAPLALVYPFTLLTFVLVGAGAVLILGETVNRIVLTGWVVIVAGVALVWLGRGPG
jgi:drug/metabolite transporter (DMT)-like permease